MEHLAQKVLILAMLEVIDQLLEACLILEVESVVKMPVYHPPQCLRLA